MMIVSHQRRKAPAIWNKLRRLLRVLRPLEGSEMKAFTCRPWSQYTAQVSTAHNSTQYIEECVHLNRSIEQIDLLTGAPFHKSKRLALNR
jgi:hypothetical protein